MATSFRTPVFRLFALAGLLTSTALAQSTTFLTPERFDLPVFDFVALRLDVAPPLEHAPRDAFERVETLYIRCAGSQRNIQRPRGDADGLLRIRMTDGGVALCSFDAVPHVETFTTTELRRFLGEHTHVLLGHTPRETQTVRHIQCGKALVRVHHPDESVPHSATAQSKTGQAVEIRPLGDPTSLRIPSDLPLRIYLPPGHDDVEMVGIVATHLPSQESQSVRTGPGGIARIRLDRPGPWRIEAHHARWGAQEEPRPNWDWTIASATLTFDVRP